MTQKGNCIGISPQIPDLHTKVAAKQVTPANTKKQINLAFCFFDIGKQYLYSVYKPAPGATLFFNLSK